jgi:glycosyltransferase involved in cell wall biosynthesis
MQDKAKIALLIPVYNNNLGLIKSLKSLEKENTLFMTVIADDGSSQPIEINSDINIPYHIIKLEKNSGIETALNTGLKWILEQGFEYVARLDSGDMIVPDRIDEQYAFMENNPDISLLGTFGTFVDKNDKPIFTIVYPTNHEDIKKAMHLQTCFLHTAVMIRINILKHVGFYSYDYKAAEDYEFFMRILSRGYKAAILPKVMVLTENNENGISLSNRKRQLFSILKTQIKYFDFKIINSYIGVIRTIIKMFVPQVIMLAFKKRYYAKLEKSLKNQSKST